MEEPITLIMSRLHENEEDIRNMALSMLIDHIKKDPSIITVEIVEELILLYKSLKSTPKQKLADILSFIALTSDDIQTLTYRIKGGVTDLKIFGIQYVKKLVNLIIEYNRENDNNSLELFKGSDIKKEELEIVNTECIEFLIDHNAEIDCIDFLYEIKEMNRIIDKVDEYNYERVMQYLKGLSSFDNEINYVMLEIYKKMNKLIDEVLLYVKLRNIGKIEEIINRVDFHQRCQIAYILSKLNIRIENKEL
ncbi:26S proteasome regulatory subunit 4, partial [Spraguea lophii 42_110]